MTDKDNFPDFSKKRKRARTIQKPHPDLIPRPLREWLLRVSQRLIRALREKAGEQKKNPPDN